jgi:hypothetical protein
MENVKKEKSLNHQVSTIRSVFICTWGGEALSLKIQNSGAIKEKLDRFDNIKIPNFCIAKDVFKQS